MLAALGALDGAAVRFEHARQVPNGGVLCALGALPVNGLLGPARECLGKIRGYYRANHILLLLAFMGLCRIKTTEKLRGRAPGELGKLMGLDRVPEVRCLCEKLDAMSRDEASEKYAAALSRQWMEAGPEAIGTRYVDGHVTDADIHPDPSAGMLHVEVHRGSRPVVDRTLNALFKQLNEMETTFPGTELIMRYSLLGSPPAVSP